MSEKWIGCDVLARFSVRQVIRMLPILCLTVSSVPREALRRVDTRCPPTIRFT